MVLQVLKLQLKGVNSVTDKIGFSKRVISRNTNPETLKRVAIEEFYASRESGRLIAFTGSYANQHLGYPSWGDMIKQFFEILSTKLNGKVLKFQHDIGFKNLFERVKAEAGKSNPLFEATSLIWLGEFLSECDKYFDPIEYVFVRTELMKGFELTRSQSFLAEMPNISKSLFEDIRVSRAITLNYDLELEWDRFLSKEESFYSDKKLRKTIWKDAKFEQSSRRGQVESYVKGRGIVKSVVLNRDDGDTLAEFALNSPDLSTKILHLHGRMDIPETLLLSKRDYRDLYWRDSYTKLPFEYGLRSIFAGNPILFIGLGLNENDVMRTLEQFMSDNPSRIKAPQFVLWNSKLVKTDGTHIRNIKRTAVKNIKVDKAGNNLRRLHLYHAYGVHVLFDTEIAELSGLSEAEYFTKIKKSVKSIVQGATSNLEKGEIENALRMELSLSHLASFCDAKWKNDFWNWENFRSPQQKYQSSNSINLVEVWSSSHKCESYLDTIEGGYDLEALKAVFDNSEPLMLAQGAPGVGKGAFANAVGDFKIEQCGNFVVRINASFATETDSIFGIVSGAFDRQTAQSQKISRMSAFEEFFDLSGDDLQDIITRPNSHDLKPVTLIINGMERFISQDGTALSNELDNLIRKCIKMFETDGYKNLCVENGGNFFHLILVGTNRLERYVSKITSSYCKIEILNDRKKQKKLKVYSKKLINEEKGKPSAKRNYAKQFELSSKSGHLNYFENLALAFSKENVQLVYAPSKLTNAIGRRVLLGQVLSMDTLKRAGVNYPKLALELIRTIAFIGQPVALEVLLHCPAVLRETSVKLKLKQKHKLIVSTVSKLLNLNLCISLTSFEDSTSDLRSRIGLHKSVTAEIRDRYGVPLSDSKLACSFNLSLFAAQPVDGYMPELEWHDHLAELTDHMIGAYKDDVRLEHSFSDKELISLKLKMSEYGHNRYSDDQFQRMLQPCVSSCLRAGLSLVRNYYSMAALLMHGQNDFDPRLRPAPLKEHSRRLRRIIRTARDVAFVRKTYRDHRPNLSDEFGAEALYPDDLVWLYNELGVVQLTLGDLYASRTAFTEAENINNCFVECGEKLQNWRRIKLNTIQLLVDRGKLETAEETIRDVESVIEQHALRFGIKNDILSEGEISARQDIIWEFSKDSTKARLDRVSRKYPTDLVLSVGVCLGYRALCATLKGLHEAATAHYLDCLNILDALGEQRAYAWFQKHAAANYAATSNDEDAKNSIRLSVAAAGATRQTDIDHHARITLVQYRIGIEEIEEGLRNIGKIPQLMETLRYANANDMYRLQVEAMQIISWVHLNNGDYDSALRYVSDAISVASRYGYGLRKASLRTLLARIFIQRGDRRSGLALLKSATRVATKLRYDKAVETAENVRVTISEV